MPTTERPERVAKAAQATAEAAQHAHEAAQAAFRRSVEEQTAVIAGNLQSELGQRLVAYVTGTRTPKVVGRWAQGVEPRDDARQRLRDLYRTVLILEEAYTPDTVRAWLEGSNPDLDNQAPVEILRTGDQAPRVFEAAASFVH
jgi:hypothetical protein